jgi:CHASE2 domain-containing sensor protein
MKARVRAALRKTISVATLITIGLILLGSYVSESGFLRRHFPVIVSVELHFHRLLNRLDFREAKSKFVTIVEVDDSSFWHPPFSGVQPTNRRALADLALSASKQFPAVIAFDFAWKSPTWEPRDDDVRGKGNKYLLETISAIATRKKAPVISKSVPVVVTTGLVDNKHGAWIREPNIFEDTAYEKAGASVGHINLPLDPRQIPLQMKAWEWNSRYEREFDSFAFEVAEAYERAAHISPSVGDNSSIRDAMNVGEFVFGGFLDRDAFPRVSASDLLKSKGTANLCQNRIVLIGGTWHQYSENNGPLIESFRSPVGSIPGVYLHANYIESLLDGRFQKAVPAWLAVLIDLVLAVILYVASSLPQRLGARIVLFVVLFSPLAIAYVLSASAGLYLDFIIPLLLLSAHLAIDHYREAGGPAT